jgi:hypothetical protein
MKSMKMLVYGFEGIERDLRISAGHCWKILLY